MCIVPTDPYIQLKLQLIGLPSVKTFWTIYQIALRCYIFDSPPPCPPNNVAVENYDTKCCLQNQHYLGGGREGSALSKQHSKN